MKFYGKRIVVAAGVLFAVLCFHLYGFGQAEVAEEESFESPFRYIIVANTREQYEFLSEPRRSVMILLDEKSFSEDNLRILFGLVSKRFPEPKKLYVDVVTNLEQLSTPEEQDRFTGGVSGEPGDPDRNKYYWAVYFRNRHYEGFNYSPVNDKTDIKRVVIREHVER